MNFKMNTRGDIASAFYIVMFLAIVGIVLLLITSLNVQLFGELKDQLGDAEYSDTEAYSVTEKFYDKYNSRLWDWVFFAIFMGSVIAVGLSAWAVRISPIFFWIYGLLSLFVLTVGVILSNLWQALAADTEFTSVIANFPITNSLLGTYYPMVVTGILFIFMIILFGKPPEAKP